MGGPALEELSISNLQFYERDGATDQLDRGSINGIRFI